MPHLIVLQHLEREGPGLFSKIARKKGMSVSTIRVDLGEKIPSPQERDVFLILGGPMGIRDISNPSFPWFQEEINLIIKCLKDEIGLIGVCLGAQLLAYVAGGDVSPLKGGFPKKDLPEIGWGSIFSANKNKKEAIMTSFHSPLNVFHWHGDRILLPPQAHLLASSERCREQFFRIGQMAYGLQFHVEIENPTIERWVEEDHDFAMKALGTQAKDVLYKQCKVFSFKSKSARISLIEGLLNELNHK